jgi:hypothetical protein
VTALNPLVKRIHSKIMPSRIIGIEIILNGVSHLPLGFISLRTKLSMDRSFRSSLVVWDSITLANQAPPH